MTIDRSHCKGGGVIKDNDERLTGFKSEKKTIYTIHFKYVMTSLIEVTLESCHIKYCKSIWPNLFFNTYSDKLDVQFHDARQTSVLKFHK